MYLSVQIDLQVCGIFGDMNDYPPQDRFENIFEEAVTWRFYPL